MHCTAKIKKPGFAIETSFVAILCLWSSRSTQCVRDLGAGRAWPLSVRTARVIKNQLSSGLRLEAGWSQETGEKALGEWWLIWVLPCLALVSCDNEATDKGTLLMPRSLCPALIGFIGDCFVYPQCAALHLPALSSFVAHSNFIEFVST